MITVHRITVDNFRALGHAIFEPLIDGGMTAVNGPNGVGKSSLLTAMMWALYGVTPDGVTTSALRRQGSTGEVRVEVVFEHDGQVITFTRGLKGTRDATYVKVLVDGREQTFGKISASQTWLSARFGGLDAEGFMTAFVIRQKELDDLVKAKPAERRKLIEKLAGIDRMSAAVTTARAEETEVKRRLEYLPGDPEAVALARKDLDEAQEDAGTAWSIFETAQGDADQAARSLAEAEEEMTALTARLTAHATARDNVSRLGNAAEVATERLNGAQAHLDRVTAAAVGGTDAEVAAAREAFGAAQAAAQQNRDARESADRAVAEFRRERAAADQAIARANRARAEADRAQANLLAAQQAAEAFPSDLTAQADAAERQVAEMNERKGALLGEYTRLDGSIKALDASTDGAHCPTCQTNLPDPARLLAQLQDAQQRVKAEGTALGEQVTAQQAEATRLRQGAAQAAQAQQQVQHAQTQAAQATQAATEAAAEAAAAGEVAGRAEEAAHRARQDAEAALANSETVAAEVERTGAMLRRAESAAQAAAEVSTAEQQATAARQAADQARAAAEEARRIEVEARVPEAEVTTVQGRFRSAQQTLSAAEQTRTAAEGDFRVAQERARSAEKVRDAEEAKLRARTETVAELERKTAVRETLDTFRKDRIASLAPELSEVATDHIARMSDGKFVSVELDEEFTSVVTDNLGRMRPSTWLSGGEESAVALALRLAIGEVIAGQQGGLLWMDEPQTAMDAQRRPAMMSVVRELPGRQPIMISHVTEATDMVDLVLDVVPDDDNGSTVVRGGDSNLIDEALVHTDDVLIEDATSGSDVDAA